MSRPLFQSLRPLLLRRAPLRPFAPPRLRLLPRNPHRFYASASAAAPPPPKSFSARIKSLTKEYGYSAVGVYLGLSALDFPFCFLAVRTLGTERIGEWEDTVVAFFKPLWRSFAHAVGLPAGQHPRSDVEGEVKDRWDEVEEKEKDAEKAASIWTELALAYAIHKSFIFIRVPITAAVTPKVVRILRGWGWDIGKPGKPKISMPKRKDKAEKAARKGARK